MNASLWKELLSFKQRSNHSQLCTATYGGESSFWHQVQSCLDAQICVSAEAWPQSSKIIQDLHLQAGRSKARLKWSDSFTGSGGFRALLLMWTPWILLPRALGILCNLLDEIKTSCADSHLPPPTCTLSPVHRCITFFKGCRGDSGKLLHAQGLAFDWLLQTWMPNGQEWSKVGYAVCKLYVLPAANKLREPLWCLIGAPWNQAVCVKRSFRCSKSEVSTGCFHKVSCFICQKVSMPWWGVMSSWGLRYEWSPCSSRCSHIS